MLLSATDIVANINSYLQIIIMILIFFTGILLTSRNRFMQITKFGYSMKKTIGKTVSESIKKDKKDKKKISPFAAFATAVAGTVGTGNIVGVATAIISGGPGAIFWMWVSAFFGMVTNYSENTLGIYFRDKDKNGEYRGGAMYYIVRGLGKSFKWLAVAFAIFAVFASVGYNFAQSNSIVSTLVSGIETTWSDWVIKLIFGIILAFVLGLVIIGGIKRISTITSLLVPFMAVLYIVLALIIIFMNINNVGSAFVSIFSSAFSFKSIGGGILGYTIIRACRYGVARGIFSNEAGLGSSVMAHSAADVKEPVDQGLWGIFEVFLDTFVICTLTALVILTSGIDISGTIKGAEIGLTIFKENLGIFGEIMYKTILPLFAFTTLISWSYYGEKAIEYIFGFKSKQIYRICYIFLVLAGSVLSVDLVWELADTFNIMMAIPNLIALIVLSGLVAKITKNYFDRKKNLNVFPLMSYEEEQNKKMYIEEMVDNGLTYEESLDNYNKLNEINI
ncbi:MAG: alanine:cation symporter family protein [Acholeplasmatales bacterium]|nr:alanine:cation symporter family protein [Acholeplasmatales bacterium]